MTKDIGSMNGRWQWIFKATLTVVPFLLTSALACGVWLNSEIAGLREWRAETTGNRWTSTDHARYVTSHEEKHAVINREFSLILEALAEIRSDLRWIIKSIEDSHASDPDH
jgi:hypothetical protein